MDIKIVNLIPELENYDFPGIYAIRNVDKEKFYVGSTVNLKNRLYQHSKDFDIFARGKKNMISDYKNGDNFEFILLERIPFVERLETYEAYYCGMYNSIKEGYNTHIPKRTKVISNNVITEDNKDV